MSRSRASAKAAGSRFERSIADCFKEHVSEFVDRKVQTGAKDTGDIANVRTNIGKRVTVECKDVATLSLGTWVAEAEAERVNASDDACVAIHRRRGKADPLDQYVTTTVRDLIVLLTGIRP